MSSVIHQNVYMFDESIQNNICLHKQITPTALQKALDMRVAVARALAQEKPILILDEGTSAVDMQTAYDIESQLLKIRELTVITITHSLNAKLLKRYDQLLQNREQLFWNVLSSYFA